MSIDITLVQEDHGLVWHQANCPDVDKARRDGKPLLSMFDCKHDVVDGYVSGGRSFKVKRHTCLQPKPEL